MHIPHTYHHTNTKALKALQTLRALPYTTHHAWVFENAWLCIAHVALKQQRPDMADALAHQALQHNKACSRAWAVLAAAREQQGQLQVHMHWGGCLV